GGTRIPDHVLDTDAAGRQGSAEQTQMIGVPGRRGNMLEAIEQVVKNELVGPWRDRFQELFGEHSIKTDAGEFYLVQTEELAGDRFQGRLQIDDIDVGLGVVQGEALRGRECAGAKHQGATNRRPPLTPSPLPPKERAG